MIGPAIETVIGHGRRSRHVARPLTAAARHIRSAMHRFIRVAVLLEAVALIAAGPPPAPMVEHVDRMFGMTFADPYRTIPEAARLLRPGGLLAWNSATPLLRLLQ